MQANIGGTEILNPVTAILNEDIIKGYPKQVFLLTDGEVYNADEIIKVVKKNIKYSRMHTIGIGKDASRKLIIGCAK